MDTQFVIDPQEPTVVSTRTFDAPRRLVFEAFTRPEHLKRWYGPHGYTVASAQLDLRPGGAYRFVNRDPAGKEYGFRGVFREIRPPEKIVNTWIFEELPARQALQTVVLEEREGRTTVTTTLRFLTLEDREGYLMAGATDAAAQRLDRLAQLLREEQAKAPLPEPRPRETPARSRR